MKTQNQLEQNKALAERWHYDFCMEVNLTVGDEILAPDIIFHSAGQDIIGIDQVKKWLEGMGDQTNLEINHPQIIAEGNLVMILWDASFDNAGDFMGIPATGKNIKYGGIDLFLILDGKIKEVWQYYDQLGFMAQFGMELKMKETAE